MELDRYDKELNSRNDDLDANMRGLGIHIDVFLRKLARDKNQLTFHLEWDSSNDKFVLAVEEAEFGGKKSLEPTWAVETMLNLNNNVLKQFIDCIKNYVEKYITAN